MIVVPLISLSALWAFSATLTVPNAISNANYNSVAQATTAPSVVTLTTKLPLEQQQTYIWLLSGRQAPKKDLNATRALISGSLQDAETKLLVGQGQRGASSTANLDRLEADLRTIPDIRKQVDAGELTASQAFQTYSTIIDDQFQSYYASVLDQGGTMQGISVGGIDSALALNDLSREVTLVAGALSVTHGQMSHGVQQLFISSVSRLQFLMNQTLSLLSPGLRAGYVTLIGTQPYKQFLTMEDAVASTPPGHTLTIDHTQWTNDTTTILQTMLTDQTAIGAQLQALSGSASNRLFTEAILAGGVGLLAVVVSVFLMVWFGRKVTGDLTRLNGSVRAMAEERLPSVVARLRRGDDVDVAAESPPPHASSIEEISQVADSFGTVQQAAVAAAVDQARLRKGVNQVFLNISLRNQSLLHRQLGMLDSMERRTSDPNALADLFRLDHLTTRMRRHAEGLIILSGSTPGRGWRDPVPVVDVLRAAVAEVEDYVRVDVTSESTDLVAGSAVNDIIHLVAELVENATVFSPPNTRVEVRADRAGAGLVAEIEDRGLGLSPEELADINARLASPREFDLANSEQLGLFVVSRLAVRHSIKVSLRPSVYGGTTAIIVLPFGVIVREEDAALGSRSASGHRGPALAPFPEPGDARFPEATPSPFGRTGRHRLAATGRRADTGPMIGLAEPAPEPPRRSLPAPPWEVSAQAQEVARPAESRPPWETGPAATPPEPAPGPAKQPAPGTATPGSHLGMPVRVPQASLAPQLKNRRGGAQPVSPPPPVGERSPETTRNMMFMMQQGWERGRVDDIDDPPGALDNETER
ncbi:sensor histidine kinase [Trebonia kvetii]|nr:ATP-binding protein [Trebonia kvetii]